MGHLRVPEYLDYKPLVISRTPEQEAERAEKTKKFLEDITKKRKQRQEGSKGKATIQHVLDDLEKRREWMQRG